jgi:SEC-C motif-containing protein
MNNLKPCYCGSVLVFKDCCQPYILGYKTAPSALALMKSRYSAYAIKNGAYLLATTHATTKGLYELEEILQWATQNLWQKLEIVSFSETNVRFKAYFIDSNHKRQVHKEDSVFLKQNGHWYYVEGFSFD